MEPLSPAAELTAPPLVSATVLVPSFQAASRPRAPATMTAITTAGNAFRRTGAGTGSASANG